MRTLSIISMGLLILFFQNCAPSHAPIINEAKEKTLAEKSVFGSDDLSDKDEADIEKDDKVVHFTFVCPSTNESSLPHKNLLEATELKLIVRAYAYETQQINTICEVSSVKKSLLDTRAIDLSSCPEIPSALNANLELYLVEENIHDHFAENRLNIETSPATLGGYSVAYATLDRRMHEVACDEAGAPLMVQIPGAEEAPLELSAPSEGVTLNLLGNSAYPMPHTKEHVSWFKKAPANTYFLVKPNKDGLVLGVDEMFADTSRGPDAKQSRHGFAALEKYDENKDLIIDSEDAIFKELRLWKDVNLDGIAQEDEIFSLVSMRIVVLDLKYDSQYREVDAYGNITRYKSVVLFESGAYGLIYDLGLRLLHSLPPKAPPHSLRAPAAFISEPNSQRSEALPTDNDPQKPESSLEGESPLVPANSSPDSSEKDGSSI